MIRSMELAARAGTRRALEAASFPEAFQVIAEQHAERVAVRTLGDAFTMTWGEYAQRVERTAAGLAALGLGPGDSLALMLVNRPEFHWVDTAALHLGAIPFSIYNTSAPEQIEYLLGDAGNRIIVTESAFLERVLAAKPTVSSLEHVLLVDGPADGALALDEVEASGGDGFDLEAHWRAVAPDDLLTLIYTSGTTGPPKGVELTHGSMLAALRSYERAYPLPEPGRMISYLPMAHIAERWWSHYHSLAHGDAITCVPDPAGVVEALADARPTRFLGVPRVWEKIKSALEASMASEPDDQKRRALQRAVELGLRKVRAQQAGEELTADLLSEYEQADELLLSKIRTRLGLDRVLLAGIGAAPSPVEVLEFFHALGIDLCEGWAMSETSAAGAINVPGEAKLGTVGRPLPGVELRLDDDGELLVRGDNVMLGYRNMPDKTREVIDEHGWLRTGDIAEIDEDGYVSIVDRKKELIISAAGKNMSPANIEARLKSSHPLIGQAVAIGDGRPYNTALLVLDPDACATFAREHRLADGSAAALAGDARVDAAVAAAIDEANSHLSRVEQIKRFTVLDTDWEPGGDELTPTMKLKRKPIAEKYAGEIEQLYSG
jgi:long-subunit acyl-CoA synthetase (AMP-forming)